MKYCTNCGEKRLRVAKYCPKCGTKFDDSNDVVEVKEKENQSLISEPIIEIQNDLAKKSKKEIMDKILIFLENINGKKLFIYNLCVASINYSVGYFLGFKFGINFTIFFILLFFDLVIGGIGYWFRSSQFPKGRLLFFLWAIGIILSDMTQVNETLFHITFLTDYKSLYFIFSAPSALYLIFKDRPSISSFEA